MFDEATNEALKKLSNNELKKVSMMIQKLAGKQTKTKRKNSRPNKSEDNKVVSVAKTNSRRVRSEPVPTGPRENLFEKMQEFNQFKEDEETRSKLYGAPPSPRNRKSNLVDVFCMNCGGGSSVAASLVPAEQSRYLCNRCQVRGARG